MQCLCGPDTSLCTNVASVHPSWLSPHFLFPFFPIFSSSPSIPLCRLYLVYPQFLLFPSSSSLSHIPLLPFLFQVHPLVPFASSPFPFSSCHSLFCCLPISPNISSSLPFAPFFPPSSLLPSPSAYCPPNVVSFSPVPCPGLKEKWICFSKMKIIFLVWHYK